jgi:alkylation response protein AidB-like acyl-CoA dehydrogenase
MFDLNRSQQQIQTAARKFARGEFDPGLEFEENRKFPEKIWKKAASLGFLGIQFSENYSGGDLGLLEASLVAESFCRVDSSMGIALTQAGIGSEMIFRFGQDTLKEKILPQICEGHLTSAIAFSENFHGMDVSAINTRADFTKNRIVINGNKTHVADRGTQGGYLVLCQTGQGEGDKDPSKTLSLVWVEGDQQGLSVVDAGLKFATNMVKSVDLTLDNVTVPAANLVGKQGDGLGLLEHFYDEIKIVTAAQALGIAQGALDLALGYIKQRQQFNRKLCVFQITRHKIAQMVTKIEQARLITYKAAHLFDQGKKDTGLISMAKMAACRSAVEVSDEAIQLFGGYGYMKESRVEQFFRDAKMTELSFGSPMEQRDIISDSLIGRVK